MINPTSLFSVPFCFYIQPIAFKMIRIVIYVTIFLLYHSPLLTEKIHGFDPTPSSFCVFISVLLSKILRPMISFRN